MKIKVSENFRIRLAKQVRYIAEDKPTAARKFRKDILSEIRYITKFPYSYRKSIFFDNEEIRDLIYKGYTVTFRIKKEEEVIEVLGFYKYQNKKRM